MDIILIGFRCSGKTTIGKIIAKKLAMEFMDTDDVIEHRTGMTIEALVKKEGWKYFREIEKKIVVELSQQDSMVVATGGGIPLDRNNVKKLKTSGWVVWLKARPSVIKQRMRQQLKSGLPRPSLTGRDPVEEVDEILAERSALYQKIADFVVETDTKSPREEAEQIIAHHIQLPNRKR